MASNPVVGKDSFPIGVGDWTMSEPCDETDGKAFSKIKLTKVREQSKVHK